MSTTPRRSGRPSGISSIGLTGAPSSAAPISVPAPAPDPEPVETPVTPRGRGVVRPQRGAAGAPRADAETTVSYTLRLDVADSRAADRLVLDLCDDTGRRVLDRSEVIRVLLRLAAEDSAVRAALIGELTTS